MSVYFAGKLGSSNLEDTVWKLDQAHHVCAAKEETIDACTAAVQTQCAEELDANGNSYTCPATAAEKFNLDRFARACYLPQTEITGATGVIQLIDDSGVLDPSLHAGFACICEQCLSESYAGCQWISGQLNYSACRDNLDCYADNENLNWARTVFVKHTDCWSIYQWGGVVIGALVLLGTAIAVIYRVLDRRGSTNVTTNVDVD
jgi:hypothetical protein